MGWQIIAPQLAVDLQGRSPRVGWSDQGVHLVTQAHLWNIRRPGHWLGSVRSTPSKHLRLFFRPGVGVRLVLG